MPRKIDRILAKKSWSGKEVGLALLAGVIHDAKHLGEPDHKPLFSQEDFNRMEDSLKDESDFIEYGVYKALYNSIVDSYNRGLSIIQQFYNGYYRYAFILTNCMEADKAMETQDDTQPLILTQSQYERYYNFWVDHFKNVKESFTSLLFSFLGDFVKDRSTAPAHIAELIEATKEEEATNADILEAHRKSSFNGYYTLPDGRRSDRLSSEEWKKAVADFQGGDKPNASELFYYGIDGIKDLYLEKKGTELIIEPDEEALYLTALEDYIKFERESEHERLLEKKAPTYRTEDGFTKWNDQYLVLAELLNGAESTIKWTYYDTTPELTKHGALVDYFHYYNLSVEDESASDRRDAYNAFKEDYPALSSAMEEYVKETVEPLRSYKPNQYHKEAITWGELADLNIPNFAFIYDVEIAEALDMESEGATARERFEKYRKYRRAINGTAIIKNPTESQLDGNGDYAEPDIPTFSLSTLDHVADTDKERESLNDFMESLIKPALRYLYSHNDLMEILGKVYDIPDMDVMKISTESLEEQVDGLNDTLFSFYLDVYGDDEESKRKRELIRDVFTPLYVADLQPTPEAKRAVKKTLSDYGLTEEAIRNLRYFDALIYVLSGEGA